MSDRLASAVALVKRGHTEQAQTLLAQLLVEDPKNVEAWVWLARALDDPTRKRESLKYVLTLDPHNTTAQALLAELDRPPTPNLFSSANIRANFSTYWQTAHGPLALEDGATAGLIAALLSLPLPIVMTFAQNNLGVLSVLGSLVFLLNLVLWTGSGGVAAYLTVRRPTPTRPQFEMAGAIAGVITGLASGAALGYLTTLTAQSNNFLANIFSYSGWLALFIFLAGSGMARLTGKYLGAVALQNLAVTPSFLPFSDRVRHWLVTPPALAIGTMLAICLLLQLLSRFF